MRGLLADVHAEGHLASLIRVCRGNEWRELWDHLNVASFRLADVGLSDTTIDVDLWEFCQREQFLLVTGNRNHKGPDSLEAAIEHGGPDSLPVLTLANIRRLRDDRQYLQDAAVRMMEIILDLDRYRGTGRLYLPAAPT